MGDSGHSSTGKTRSGLASIAMAAAGVVGIASNADAYLDPGTGGLVVQVVMGALLAAGFTVKVWWRKIRSLVPRNGAQPTDSDEKKG